MPSDRLIAVSRATADDVASHYGVGDDTVRVVPNGVDEIFTPEMLRGGYRKKYLRATSRILALARDAG